MSEQKLKGIMDTSMDKLRAMVDADIVIGTPIKLGQMTLIPVSKVAFLMVLRKSALSEMLSAIISQAPLIASSALATCFSSLT